jgi:hypothetical protein
MIACFGFNGTLHHLSDELIGSITINGAVFHL